MAGNGRGTLWLTVCIFAGAVVGVTGLAIAMDRLCFCDRFELLDYLAHGMFFGGFGASAVAVLALMMLWIGRAIERADRRARERATGL